MTLGQKVTANIRGLRGLRHISQEIIADHVGITQSAWSKLEKNGNSITLAQLELVSEVLQVSPDILLSLHSGVVFQLSNNKNATAIKIESASRSEWKILEEYIESQKREIVFLKQTIDKLLINKK